MLRSSNRDSVPAEGSPVLEEILRGNRFSFGENWTYFLRVLTEERIREAGKSLQNMLGVERLDGSSVLDIGCGSGLFSLAARRLGARVHSFDYDPQSTACAQQLKERFFPSDSAWTIEAGSILDPDYTGRLGRFDLVYSWGVLHHTGSVWEALDQAMRPVASGGRLWIALYNYQPTLTSWWTLVKRAYQCVPAALRPLYVAPFFLYVTLAGLVADLLRGDDPRRRYRGLGRRGMSLWHDVVDWVGGWPFQATRPADVVAFAKARGLEVVTVKTVGRRHGCNEFLFARPPRLENRA